MVRIPRRRPKRCRHPFFRTLVKPTRPRRLRPEPVNYERLIEALGPVWREFSRVHRRLEAVEFARRDARDDDDDRLARLGRSLRKLTGEEGD